MENKLKLLVYNQDEKYQQTKLEELKLLFLEINKAEERFSVKADIMQSSSFFISFLSILFTVWSKFVFGNNISMQVLVLLLLYFLSIYIFSNSWYYKRLTSYTKCLGKTAQEVIDCFSTDNNIFTNP
ncbi:MAG: hypothetical protein HC939_21045 [Pleurocapsa sp. SU_5_0]|nr:hypothetical protein [Pleurocapsa sp. SU_5_0]